MKVVIPGGSGQVGTILARAFYRDGHDVVVVSRRPQARAWRVVPWDGATLGGWQREIDGCDAVINLAGRSVNCRYNPANRQEILQSRVLSTRAVGRAIAAAARPPRVWLQASTATIYAHRYDAANDERSGILGGGEANAPDTWRFSIDVARAWERAFDEAAVDGTRKIALRSAMTMSPDPGGIFDTLLGLARHGLGGRAGDGRQFISWIHEQDFIAALRWLIDRDDIEGVVNVAAPNPLPNVEFMRVLREASGVRLGLPVAKWMLEIGAVFMRTETELILKSRRVVPGRLLEHGFRFRYSDWCSAARDLCQEQGCPFSSQVRGERRRQREGAMFGADSPPRARMPPEKVAALVNGGIVLLGPIWILIAVLTREQDMHTVTAYVSPRWVIVLQQAMAVVALFAPFIALAAIAAARTWAHAKDYLEKRSSGWQGVAEAGGLGLVPAVMILIPATIRSPLQAPPYIVAYGGGALVIGLACGLVLRTTALLVLRVLRSHGYAAAAGSGHGPEYTAKIL